MAALGGLPLHVERAVVGGLPASIRLCLRVAGSQRWENVQVVLALLLLQRAGGEAVDDPRVLEADAGFAAVLSGRAERCSGPSQTFPTASWGVRDRPKEPDDLSPNPVPDPETGPMGCCPPASPQRQTGGGSGGT